VSARAARAGKRRDMVNSCGGLSSGAVNLRRVRGLWEICSVRTGGSGVFANDTEDLALNAYVGCWRIDGSHLGIGGLEADHAAFAVEAFEGGVGAVDERDDYLAFAGGACALDEDVVSGDDVFVTHGVSAHFKSEDLPIADDIAEGDGFRGLDGFDGLTGSDPSHQGESLEAFLRGARWQDVDRSAAIVGSLEKPFVLQVGDVFMNGCEGVESETSGDLFVRRRVTVLLGEAGEEVDDFFLPSGNCHDRIVANKKRIAST
jgi:hypothetical protein